ncbi:MAG: hypothetical protein EBY20_12170, partial [Alphaproteobacteria bacterium]|nr:hypothetical protein [Alphaproteobacteria bacterium]
MIKISCYKTTQEKLSRAFCNLAEKCYHSAIKIFVYTNSKEQAFELDTVLWIYSRKQFIQFKSLLFAVCIDKYLNSAM